MTAPTSGAGARTVEPIGVAWVPTRELSPNASRKMPRGMRTRLQDESRFLGYTLGLRLWNCGNNEQAEDGPRRRLTITVTRPRLMDDDNLIASLKWFRDGLVKGGIARDDSAKWLEVVVKQEKGKPPSTWVRVEELADA